MSDSNDEGQQEARLDTDVFIERNWFHLDSGCADLGADQIADRQGHATRKGREDAVTLLMGEMASQYNTAVVSAAYYREAWARCVARVRDLSTPRPAIDAEGELLGIFARSYVVALDGVEGCADKLGNIKELPKAARAIAKALAFELRWVREARDSLSHIEERVQGLEHGKRIPTSLLVLGGHSDRGFNVTIRDGTLVTIEVSETVLASLRSQISALHRSLTWRRAGPVCPACGGSISPDVIRVESDPTVNPPAIEWHCCRCGFRQRVDPER